jgi:hypothetical protein
LAQAPLQQAWQEPPPVATEQLLQPRPPLLASSACAPFAAAAACLAGLLLLPALPHRPLPRPPLLGKATRCHLLRKRQQLSQGAA